MPEYDNTNTGALFKNDKKETDKHPDYKGSVNANGREYWLSAWLKTSKKGTKFMSLSLSPKEARGEESQESSYDSQDTDSVPF